MFQKKWHIYLCSVVLLFFTMCKSREMQEVTSVQIPSEKLMLTYEVYGQSDFYLKIKMADIVVFWSGMELNPTKDIHNFLLFKGDIEKDELHELLKMKLDNGYNLWLSSIQSFLNKEIEDKLLSCTRQIWERQETQFMSSIFDSDVENLWHQVESSVAGHQPFSVFEGWNRQITSQMTNEQQDDLDNQCVSFLHSISVPLENKTMILGYYLYTFGFNELFNSLNQISRTSKPIKMIL